jgi:hypothetical protein
MADSSQTPKSKQTDTFTAKRTLNFFGRCLREQRFILRGQILNIRKLKREERETRKKINNLNDRIRVEFEMNPGLFKKLNTQD